MVTSTPQRRTTRYRGRRLAFRLDLEALETRTLPSVTSWPGLLNPMAETEPNDTLDQAQNLGDLTTTPRADVIGTITNGTAGGGVDWYSFQLDQAANVSLTTPPIQTGGQSGTTLSLYNTDLYDANDPYDLLNHRVLAQSDSAANGGTAQINRSLAPGTYYVAVSGSGNHYFNPFLVDSGYAGATGDYGLRITAANLGLDATNGPAVLATDPQPGSTLDHSPWLIRVDTSEPLDPSTVAAGSSVQLLSNANGTFGDGNDQVVNLASATLSTDGTELLVAPAAPLAPGYYKVVLAGNSNANPQVLADPDGLSLGTNSAHVTGADFAFTFQVNGNEGNTGVGTPADDSAATSHDLGDLSQTGFVQVAGAIGVDSTDPVPFDGSDVDMYHFQVGGTGRYAFSAEVFAGRIGSPLSPGISLFQSDPTTGQLTLLGSNSGTQNSAAGTDGSVPLYTDPALFAGLQAGDYYVAVSNNFNMPDPATSPVATNGGFDPTVSLRGQNGGSTGDYVLNMQVQPAPAAPQVTAVSLNDGETLTTPPTFVTVQFSENVNLLQLAQTPVNGTSGTLAAVYVQGSGGTNYYPRLYSYDTTTQQATFLMRNGLINGNYTLHLSPSLGLTDMAGNPLVGNDPGGDYVVHFTVNWPVRGTGTNPLLWSDTEPNDDATHAQDLGVLYWHDLQTGITVQRDFTSNPGNAPADTADYYQFQVVGTEAYTFNFPSATLPGGVQASLFDASGTPINVSGQPNSAGFSVFGLRPGSYVLKIGNWTTSQAAGVAYTMVINLGTNPDNPVPLTAGPAPAISIQLVTNVPPPPPAAPLVVTPPPVPPPTVVSTPPAPPTTPPSPPSNPPTNPPDPISTVPSGPANNPPTPVVVTTTPPPPTTVVTTTPPLPSAPPVSIALPTPGTVTQTPANFPTTNVVTGSPPPAPAPSSAPGSAELPAPATVLAPALSTSLTGPIAVPVNLVAPAGSGNAGVAPALLRMPVDRPTEVVSVPSSVLLALGAAPVGAVRDSAILDTPAPVDRSLVHLPDMLSSKSLQPTTIAIPRADSGTTAGDASAAVVPARYEPTSLAVAKLFQRTPPAVPGATDAVHGKLANLLSQGLRQLANSSYARALDALFGMAQWLEDSALQAPKAPSLEDPASQDESAGFETRESISIPDEAAMPNVSERVLVHSLGVLAVLAVARSEKKPSSEMEPRKQAVVALKSENGN